MRRRSQPARELSEMERMFSRLFTCWICALPAAETGPVLDTKLALVRRKAGSSLALWVVEFEDIPREEDTLCRGGELVMILLSLGRGELADGGTDSAS